VQEKHHGQLWLLDVLAVHQPRAPAAPGHPHQRARLHRSRQGRGRTGARFRSLLRPVSPGPAAFLLVQCAFGGLPPRLNLFRDHPIVWRTFGFAIGVFLFSVTTARVIGDQTKRR